MFIARLAFPWVVLAAVSICSWAQQVPSAAAATLRERSEVERARRLATDERIAFFTGKIRDVPADLRYPAELALAYLQKMRETTDFSYVDRADKLVQGILAKDAENYEAAHLQVEIELNRHRFKEVAALSQKLIARQPRDQRHYGTLGDAFMELGKYDEAADAYQKMVDLRPDLTSYNRVAWYRFVAGDLPGAIEIMTRAVQSGGPPENVAWVLVELGNLYQKSGKTTEALAAYERALAYFPNYHPALAARGRTQQLLKMNQEALASFLKAQSIVPLPEYAAALFDLYKAAGQTAAAEKQWGLVEFADKMMRANKEQTNRALALVYADHDRQLPRALELAQAELSVRQDIYTYDALAWALYKNKQLPAAQAAMRQALRMKTPEPLFQQHAAVILPP